VNLVQVAYETATVLASHAHDHAWGGGWWWLFALLKIALVIGIFFAVSRGLSWRRPSSTDAARSILAERYARDELSADEYKRRLAELK
jgi:putative membrane protein